jgi:uroporphyrinogen decarboxylase
MTVIHAPSAAVDPIAERDAWSHQLRAIAATPQESCKVDIMYLAEDLAGQHGPLFSLETYRKFLLRGQKKMADLARSFGIWVFYHADGAARAFIPDRIDVLNPLQWRCPGMELESLVRDSGRHVAFHGGIDNRQTLPFGTVEDIRREVRNVARIMERARWIFALCHNIQAIGPAENVIAMCDEAASLTNRESVCCHE